MVAVTPSPALQLSAAPAAPGPRVAHALPPRPNFDSFESSATALGFGAAVSPKGGPDPTSSAITGITGSDHDWVANRRAIRMANMSAAEMIKAEMMSAMPVSMKPGARKKTPPPVPAPIAPPAVLEGSTVTAQESSSAVADSGFGAGAIIQEIRTDVVMSAESNGVGALSTEESPAPTNGDIVLRDAEGASHANGADAIPGLSQGSADVPQDAAELFSSNEDVVIGTTDESPRGTKRKIDEVEEEADPLGTFEADDAEEDAEASQDISTAVIRKVNADGTVDQEDTVRLWEPGYKERYYRQKFGVELTDTEFRAKYEAFNFERR